MANRTITAIAGAALVVMAVSCGGGGTNAVKNDEAHVLHFTGRDETVANFRSRLQKLFSDMPGAINPFCNPLKGLSPEATVPLLRSTPTSNDVFPGSTPKPGQTAVEADLVRSAAIVLEECKRVTS